MNFNMKKVDFASETMRNEFWNCASLFTEKIPDLVLSQLYLHQKQSNTSYSL